MTDHVLRLRKDMIGWQPEGDRSKSPGPAKTQYLRVPFLHFEALTVWISIPLMVPRSYGGFILAVDADLIKRSRC